MLFRSHYKKRDVNHKEIRDGLRALGAVVWDTADLGGTALDLAVFWRGQVVVVEVKPPERKGRLTEREQRNLEVLKGVGIRAIVATSIEDVVKEFSTLKTA